MGVRTPARGRGLGIETDASFADDVPLEPHRAWHRQIPRKRTGDAPKQPVADVLMEGPLSAACPEAFQPPLPGPVQTIREIIEITDIFIDFPSSSLT